jgi:DNA-binding transcriptional regulator PaaX
MLLSVSLMKMFSGYGLKRTSVRRSLMRMMSGHLLEREVSVIED